MKSNDGIVVNLFMLFIWIAIVIGMSPLVCTVSYGFCLLPVLQIAVNITSVDKVGSKTEKSMFRNSTVASLLIVIGLFVGLKEEKVNKRFGYILLLGLFFAALSTIDFWVEDEKVRGLEYFRSVCDVIAISLFLIAVVEFFMEENTET